MFWVGSGGPSGNKDFVPLRSEKGPPKILRLGYLK